MGKMFGIMEETWMEADFLHIEIYGFGRGKERQMLWRGSSHPVGDMDRKK